MVKKSKRPPLVKVDEEKFDEGGTGTKISVSQFPNGEHAGIFINTDRKVTEKYTKQHKGVWLSPRVNPAVWIKKLAYVLQRLFKKWYNKDILVSQREIDLQDEKIDALTTELADEKKKSEEMKARFEYEKSNISLAKELHPMARDFDKILDNLKNDIEKSVKDNKNIEETLKNKIKENRWFLGLDCEVRAKNKDIDTQTQIDLHIINHLNQDRIFELKSPNKKLFVKRAPESRLCLSSELCEALSELIVYMEKVDFYSKLTQPGTYKIEKPAGVIIMDYKLKKEEMSMLKNVNYHLSPHILIITYDNLIDCARKEISLIKANQVQTV